MNMHFIKKKTVTQNNLNNNPCRTTYQKCLKRQIFYKDKDKFDPNVFLMQM